MKNHIWAIFTGSVTFAILYLLNLDLWLFLVVLAPLLVIFFTYGSFLYSFREDMRAEEVPSSGYDKRIEELNQQESHLNHLEFDKIDQFYLKAIPDSVTYIFKHRHEPVYFCIYHFGPKMGYDLITHYNRRLTLTTGNSIDGGMMPRRDYHLLQIFENTDYKMMLERHLRSHQLILNNGYQVELPHPGDYKRLIISSIKEQAADLRKKLLWPALLVFWTITKRGKIYQGFLENQIRAGSVTILR